MPANTRTWAALIAVIAVILIVISLTFLSQQIQQAPVPTVTGPIPTVTIDSRTSSTAEASATQEATAEG